MNILRKLRSLYREKVQDTQREWEEVEDEIYHTGVFLEIKLPLIERLKFLFKGKTVYEVTENQMTRIALKTHFYR